MEEDELCLSVLNGLPGEFDMITTVLTVCDKVLTLEDTLAKLLLVETSHQKSTSGSKAYVARPAAPAAAWIGCCGAAAAPLSGCFTPAGVAGPGSGCACCCAAAARARSSRSTRAAFFPAGDKLCASNASFSSATVICPGDTLLLGSGAQWLVNCCRAQHAACQSQRISPREYVCYAPPSLLLGLPHAL